MENKFCIKCNIAYPPTKEYFRSNSNSKSGITLVCKKCNNQRAKSYRDDDLETKRANGRKAYYNNKHKETNKTRKKSYLKKYNELNKTELSQKAKEYAKKNKEHIKEYHKVYRVEYDKKNADKISLRKREYRKNNLDVIRERNKKWRYLNPDKCRITKHNRRSKENSLESSFDIYDWHRCLDYFDNKCAYCGSSDKIQQEHFIAVKWGGEYTRNNMIPACKSCNSSKCDSTFFVWYPKQKFYSLKREKRIIDFLGYDINTKTQQLTLVI